jgi:uncharacterized membrane protein HdeD (DUF308 family)
MFTKKYMEQNQTSNPNAGKTLGIIGLVLGILTAVISFIPCLGALAIYPGVVAIIVSIISMYQANKAKVSSGLAIAGLVCSIIGTVIAGWQMYSINKGVQILNESIENMDTTELNQSLQSLDSLTKALDSIK